MLFGRRGCSFAPQRLQRGCSFPSARFNWWHSPQTRMQQRREHTLRKELEACQTEIGRLLGLLRRHGIDPHPGN